MILSKLQAAQAAITARFVSGNDVPVERAAITATEWAVIRQALNGRALPDLETMVERAFEAYWNAENAFGGIGTSSKIRVKAAILAAMGEGEPTTKDKML